MTGNPEVIAALRSLLALEAHLNIQYRHDWRLIKFMGVKKTAHKIKDLGDKAHCFMKILSDRILVLGGRMDYIVGSITDQTTLTAIFQNELQLEMVLVQQGRQAIQTAVAAGDEDTAEKLRHIEERHEDAVGWLEQQLRLEGVVGGEGEYIAEKL